MNRKNVAIVQRFLPHYRIPFFQNLIKANPHINITIIHGGRMEKGYSGTAIGADEIVVKNTILNIFGYSLVIQWDAFRYLVSNNLDLVILEGTFGVITNMLILVIRKLMNKRTIYWTAGWDNPKITGWRKKIKYFLIRPLVKLADGAIVYGSIAKNFLMETGLDEQKIFIAQNTIDIESIISNAAHIKIEGFHIREMLGILDYQVIVYSGGITPLKRVDILLKAFHTLSITIPNLALLIIGDGDSLSSLKYWVEYNCVPNVFFLGEIIDEVENYIAAGDIFVLPGIGGLAINQAMALGIPVIATIADGTQIDLITEGENGFIANVDSVEEIASYIKMIIDDKKLAKKIGENGQSSIIERASLKNMIKKYSIAIEKNL